MTGKKSMLICAGFLLFAAHLFSQGLNLIDKDELLLALSLRMGFLGGYSISGNEPDYPVSETDIALEGELLKSIGFTVSLEAEIPSTEIDSNTSVSFNDIFIEYKFTDYLKLCLGRFKVPFGEEITESASERPYIDRPYTSRKIAPGRDIGIEASGKKILNLFGYSAGLFTGYTDDTPDEAESTILAAGKVFVKYDDIKLIQIKTGYSGYYHYYVSGVPAHHLAQNLFLKLRSSFGKKNDLSFLAEYQERLRIRNVINQNLDYTRGLFGILSYRYEFIEPFVMCEIYDKSLLYNDEDDIFSFSAGAAGYFLKDDKLRAKLRYNIEYPLYSDAVAHTISAMVFLEL